MLLLSPQTVLPLPRRAAAAAAAATTPTSPLLPAVAAAPGARCMLLHLAPTSGAGGGHRAGGDRLVCQAHPRRVAKVASQIQREVSEMFVYDKVVQQAICPERRRGLDDALSAVASVTHVHVSNDLQVVKVYVSVYSDAEGKARAIDNLKRLAPYVRSQIGAAVRLRLTPEIRFERDDTLDELEAIQEAIGREDFARYVAEAEAEARGGSAAGSAAAGAGARGAGDDEEQGEDEDEDEDEDGGFFEIPGGGKEDEEDEGEAAAASAAAGDEGGEGGEAAAVRRVAWSRHDPATFFAVDVDEDEEEQAAGDAWYSRAGPFDDLFVGGGAQLAQERRQRPQRRQGKQQQRRGKAAEEEEEEEQAAAKQ